MTRLNGEMKDCLLADFLRRPLMFSVARRPHVARIDQNLPELARSPELAAELCSDALRVQPAADRAQRLAASISVKHLGDDRRGIRQDIASCRVIRVQAAQFILLRDAVHTERRTAPLRLAALLSAANSTRFRALFDVVPL